MHLKTITLAFLNIRLQVKFMLDTPINMKIKLKRFTLDMFV